MYLLVDNKNALSGAMMNFLSAAVQLLGTPMKQVLKIKHST